MRLSAVKGLEGDLAWARRDYAGARGLYGAAAELAKATQAGEAWAERERAAATAAATRVAVPEDAGASSGATR
jgi:hypothetical protein